MRNRGIITAAIMILIGVTSLGVNAGGIKERLAKRLPTINKLKAEGAIGENNKAYLEARKELSGDNKKLINEENSDRKKIYSMLAKKTGQKIDIIESRRALAIAKKTKKGYWLQKEDGTWYQK
jgi:uncharacterized protein YdbL (DUF1318 family)